MVSRLAFCLVLCGTLCAAENWVERARQAQARGDYRGAADAWRKVVDTQPDSPEARSNFGVALHLAGDDAEALKQFRRALRQQPGLTAANLFAGVALVNLGRPREAVDYLARARSADASGIAPRLALGRAYVALREFDRANSSYKEAAALDPRNAEAWFGVGITYRRMADAQLRKSGGTPSLESKTLLAEALQALTRAVELEPRSERVHLILGEALRDAGKLLDSVQEYEIALRLHPDSVAAYLGIASAYWKSGETDSVLPPLRKVLEFSPSDPEANGIMADMLARKGDYNAAIQHAMVALAGNPGLAHVRTVLAKAYLAEGRADLAVPLLQRAGSDGADGNDYFLLYRAYKQLGRDVEAKAALAKFKQFRGLAVQP